MKYNGHAKKAGKWTNYWKDEVHDPSAPYILTKCIEISGDVRTEIELDVVEEESIKMMLDGRHLVTFLALPRELRELSVGFLICDGVLKKIEDIRSISVQDDTVFCESTLDKSDLELWTEVRSSGCIGIKSSWEGIEPITSKVKMVAKVARAGIPIVVSKAAPLSTGIALSKMVGMTLVAFVRNPNLYIYSGQERIL